MENKGEIIIYHGSKGKSRIEVRLQNETVWLTQEQITQLFDRDRTVITKHINNVFKEGELNKKSNVQKMHIPKSDKPVSFYSLDVIISVGYRVKSLIGTQFRIWATKTLKEYFIQGYIINEKRLKEKSQQLIELQNAISLIKNIAKNNELSGDEAKGLINVLSTYNEALDILDRYDHQRLQIKESRKKQLYKLNYNEAKRIITDMSVFFDSGKLFGREKDDSLKSSLYQIYQTFDKKDLYPSIEEKAANLLYLLVKNHSFVDGNKRIAASLFIWFMHKNNLLFNKHGIRIIENNMLVALTLMIAESRPEEKEMLIKVVVNLIQTE